MVLVLIVLTKHIQPGQAYQTLPAGTYWHTLHLLSLSSRQQFSSQFSVRFRKGSCARQVFVLHVTNCFTIQTITTYSTISLITTHSTILLIITYYNILLITTYSTILLITTYSFYLQLLLKFTTFSKVHLTWCKCSVHIFHLIIQRVSWRQR